MTRSNRGVERSTSHPSFQPIIHLVEVEGKSCVSCFGFLAQSEKKKKSVIVSFVELRRMALAVVVDAEYLKEVDKARRDLRALIASRNCAPLMLRLAYVSRLYILFLSLFSFILQSNNSSDFYFKVFMSSVA